MATPDRAAAIRDLTETRGEWLNDWTINETIGALLTIPEPGTVAMASSWQVGAYYDINTKALLASSPAADLAKTLTQNLDMVKDMPRRPLIVLPVQSGTAQAAMAASHGQMLDGTHWSLLVRDPATSAWYHYDSLGGHRQRADQLVRMMARRLGDMHEVCRQVDVPQQTGATCGLFTLAYASIVIAHGKAVGSGDPPWNSHEVVTRYLPELIRILQTAPIPSPSDYVELAIAELAANQGRWLGAGTVDRVLPKLVAQISKGDGVPRVLVKYHNEVPSKLDFEKEHVATILVPIATPAVTEAGKTQWGLLVIDRASRTGYYTSSLGNLGQHNLTLAKDKGISMRLIGDVAFQSHMQGRDEEWSALAMLVEAWTRIEEEYGVHTKMALYPSAVHDFIDALSHGTAPQPAPALPHVPRPVALPRPPPVPSQPVADTVALLRDVRLVADRVVERIEWRVAHHLGPTLSQWLTCVAKHGHDIPHGIDEWPTALGNPDPLDTGDMITTVVNVWRAHQEAMFDAWAHALAQHTVDMGVFKHWAHSHVEALVDMGDKLGVTMAELQRGNHTLAFMWMCIKCGRRAVDYRCTRIDCSS